MQIVVNFKDYLFFTLVFVDLFLHSLLGSCPITVKILCEFQALLFRCVILNFFVRDANNMQNETLQNLLWCSVFPSSSYSLTYFVHDTHIYNWPLLGGELTLMNKYNNGCSCFLLPQAGQLVQTKRFTQKNCWHWFDLFPSCLIYTAVYFM